MDELENYLKKMTINGLLSMATHYSAYEGGPWLSTEGLRSAPNFHALRFRDREWDVINGFRSDISGIKEQIQEVTQSEDLIREPSSGAEDVLT